MDMFDHNKESKISSNFYPSSPTPKKQVPQEVIDFLRKVEIDKGIDYLDKLLEKEPDFEDAWVKKGEFYFIAQRYEDAISAYDKALRLNADNHRAREGKQRALDELGKEKNRK